MTEVNKHTSAPNGPAIGNYHMIRNGDIITDLFAIGDMFATADLRYEFARWDHRGVVDGDDRSLDIVATICHQAMSWAAALPANHFEPTESDLEWAKATAIEIASAPLKDQTND